MKDKKKIFKNRCMICVGIDHTYIQKIIFLQTESLEGSNKNIFFYMI